MDTLIAGLFLLVVFVYLTLSIKALSNPTSHPKQEILFDEYRVEDVRHYQSATPAAAVGKDSHFQHRLREIRRTVKHATKVQDRGISDEQEGFIVTDQAGHNSVTQRADAESFGKGDGTSVAAKLEPSAPVRQPDARGSNGGHGHSVGSDVNHVRFNDVKNMWEKSYDNGGTWWQYDPSSTDYHAQQKQLLL